MDTIRDAILSSAEARMRRGGFHGFSFRDLAADVGIKSASVHYHFPTKADLGVNLMRNYQEQMLAAFGDAEDSRTLADKLGALRDVEVVGHRAPPFSAGVDAMRVLGVQATLERCSIAAYALS